MKARFILLVVALLLPTGPVAGRDSIELESTYLGEGWFKYRLKSLPDPFFSQVSLGQFGPSFTNLVEFGLPPDHGNTNWFFDFSFSQNRPYEAFFSARSSERHFKRSLGTLIISMEIAEPYCDPSFCFPGGIGGYVNLGCLAPCSADEADGSRL